MKTGTVYSVVIPFFNEERSVDELLGEVFRVMDALGKTYEIIAVDDGSADSTGNRLDVLAFGKRELIPVHFTIRRGQALALAEGFRRASGLIVISMDGDLQNDPAEIPGLLQVLEKESVDVVCGWRKKRDDPPQTLLLSKIGNFFQRLFFRMPIHDISCTFRVYRASAVKSVKLAERGIHRFLPLLLKKKGFVVAEKEVRNRRRKFGSSKYSFGKALETIKLFLKIIIKKY